MAFSPDNDEIGGYEWKGEPHPTQPGLPIVGWEPPLNLKLAEPGKMVSFSPDLSKLIKEHKAMWDALNQIGSKQMMKCELIGVAKETVANIERLV